MAADDPAPELPPRNDHGGAVTREMTHRPWQAPTARERASRPRRAPQRTRRQAGEEAAGQLCSRCPTRWCRSCGRPTARSISTPTTASTGCCSSAGRDPARPRCCCGCTCRTSATRTRRPIVVDPKSELARLCLEMTPPDCGKRVWYLDLGRPMFGMSPLRLDPARTPARAGLGDRRQHRAGDQRHRRGAGLPVKPPLPVSRRHRRARARAPPRRTGDVRGRLRAAAAGREDLREQAVNACQGYADLDHTTEFFARVLPEELENNRSNTYQRLDPPRNKIETILASPSLRRFFNHPVDIRLARHRDGARHPDRRREHGRAGRGELPGRDALPLPAPPRADAAAHPPGTRGAPACPDDLGRGRLHRDQ